MEEFIYNCVNTRNGEENNVTLDDILNLSKVSDSKMRSLSE